MDYLQSWQKDAGKAGLKDSTTSSLNDTTDEQPRSVKVAAESAQIE
jgi:hypothetical protein